MRDDNSFSLVFAASFDLNVLWPFVLLFVVLACGAVAIALTNRWYRKLNQLPSTKPQDLVRLMHALENQESLAPDEVTRIKAAIERHREENESPSEETK